MHPAARSTAGVRRLVEWLFLGLLLFATSLRGLEVSWLFEPLRVEWGEVVMEVALLAIAGWLVWRAPSDRRRFARWASYWPVIMFAALAAASTLWSIDPAATGARVLILLACTTLALYLGARYSLRELLQIAAAYFIALEVASAAVALIWPELGTMPGRVYMGSWRGIYWHRNYLGSTMAFAAVTLLTAAVVSFKDSRRRALVYAVFYIGACALVVMARSATGGILLVVLHAAAFVGFAWVRWRSRLKPSHYYGVAALLAILVALVLWKLDFFLGLFHRSSNFTGRVGLWQYLWQYVIAARPLFGHGYGALWIRPDFQVALQKALGWGYPIVIGDNGYIDIALHLGISGPAALVALLLWSCAQTLGTAISGRTTLAIFPALAVLYMLTTNITLSYFLEVESFSWLIVFAFVFAAANRRA